MDSISGHISPEGQGYCQGQENTHPTLWVIQTRSERSIKFAFILSYVFLYSDVFIMKVKIYLISIILVGCASTNLSLNLPIPVGWASTNLSHNQCCLARLRLRLR